MKLYKNNQKCVHNENDADEIIPGIWLGDLKSSLDKYFIKKNKIKNVLRLIKEIDTNVLSIANPTFYGYKYSKDGINYFHFPIKDSDFDCRDMKGFFKITNSIIKNSQNKKEPILIHCKKGHHRSGVTMACYLIKYCGYTYKGAIKKINNMRNCAMRRYTHMSEGLYKYIYSKGLKENNIVCYEEDKYFICSSEN